MEIGSAAWLQSSIGLHGREKELNELKEAYERLLDDLSPPSVYLIAGESGLGKSFLIQQSLPSSTEIIVGKGKFDQLKRRCPYSAIKDALTEVCLSLLQDDPKVLEVILDDVGPTNIPLLTGFIQVLKRVQTIDTKAQDDGMSMSTRKSNSGDSSGSSFLKIWRGSGQQDGWARSHPSEISTANPQELENRFNLALKTLVRTICKSKPLILVIDDLQWVRTHICSPLLFMRFSSFQTIRLISYIAYSLG